MSRPAAMHIDLDALQHNLQRVRECAPRSKVLAMVKGNAYGHGIKRIAPALCGADAFGVACLKEAEMIRQEGLSHPIVLMSGFFSEKELEKIIALDCQIVVHCIEQIEILEKIRLSKPLMVWVKIDTGMHRLGFSVEEVSLVYKRLKQCCSVSKPLRFMTHFSHADHPELPQTQHQIAQFNRATEGLVGERSLANSSALLKFPESQADWVRPGGCLYGALTLEDAIAEEHGFKPVMTFSSSIVAIHQHRQGEAIGYGGVWSCPESMPVGIVAVGYGDGYPRHEHSGTPVLINQTFCSLIGRVAMDMIAVDLRNCSHAKVGDSVILWGKGLPVERVAQCADTIAYDLLSSIAWRVWS